MSKRIVGCFLIIISIVCLEIVYFRYAPEETSWFPPCVFHRLTGLDCPSCGNQRALHALLHGEIRTALHYNLFLVAALPYGILLGSTLLIRNERTRRIQRRLLSNRMVTVYLTLYFVWGVLRNTIPQLAI